MTGTLFQTQGLARCLEHIWPGRPVEWRSTLNYAGCGEMTNPIMKDPSICIFVTSAFLDRSGLADAALLSRVTDCVEPIVRIDLS